MAIVKKIGDTIRPFLVVRETCLWNGGSQTGSVVRFGQNSVVAGLMVISTVLEW